MRKNILTALLVYICLIASTPASAGIAAQDVLKTAGFDQGICLVAGETDGQLTASLAKNSRMYVQGCTRISSQVDPARQTLVKAGISHRASIILLENTHLPYGDNLLNLVVVPRALPKDLALSEILRVLAPDGTAIIGSADRGMISSLHKLDIRKTRSIAGNGIVFTKPVNPKLGTWTHVKAGADQSYVNSDEVAGPWKEIQWMGDPRWGSLRMSYSGFVTAGGRIYYKENVSGWYLVARDAYNGFELWRVRNQQKRYSNPDQTLTCDENRVYILEDKKLIARDGRTGKTVKEYKVTPKAATVSGGYLITSSRSGGIILDKNSGEIIWKGPCSGHPAAAEDKAYVAAAGHVEAIDLSSGKPLWKSKVETLPIKPTHTCSVTTMHKGSVVYVWAAERYKPFGFLAAFDATNGKFLWRKDGKFSHGAMPFTDEIWCLSRLKVKVPNDNMQALVLDSRTGKEKQTFMAKGHVMAKCWRARATANYVMYSNGRYLSRQSGKDLGHTATRSPCRLGQHPANGLTYFMPHHCDCKVTIRGFLALTKPGTRNWFPKDAKGNTRLFTTGKLRTSGQDKPTNWPMYRKDIKRSNATTATLPAQLQKLWSQNVGDSALTQTTIAYGRLFTAEQRAGRVSCRDARTGKEVWSFITDGRVDFPPTLHKGMCLVATGGGSVYGLDAQTGRQAWRLRVAPAQKYVGDRNQLGSAWPVTGGVFVFKDIAYVSVGRTQSHLGGLWFCALDPATGTIKWRKRGGSSGDMFVSDGTFLVHTSTPYDPQTGKSRKYGWKKSVGMLRTSRYLGTVSIADFMACTEPSLSYKKHIQLTDGRIRGDVIAFNETQGIAGSRYRPSVKNWKKKGNTNKYFIHAGGSTRWNLHDVKQHMHSIIIAGDKAYGAGVPTSPTPGNQPELWVLSLSDGNKMQTLSLQEKPVYDGLSAANGRLYLATENGQLICFGGRP